MKESGEGIYTCEGEEVARWCAIDIKVTRRRKGSSRAGVDIRRESRLTTIGGR